MFSATLVLAFTMTAAPASDWPQWMGPTRDNVWHDTGILEKFPKDGPKVLWRAPIQGGYSGPAVAGGKVFVMDYISKDTSLNDGNFEQKPVGGTERILCFNEADGKEIWKKEYDVTYKISYPAGPRCTPLVHEGKVYTLGAMGHLACYDAEKGSVIWEKELTKVYDTKPALWGYAAHPVIDGKKLITLAGTNQGNHVIALNKETGEEIWKADSQAEQGYSPVQFATVGGVRQLIVAGPSALRGLDPETGKRFWSQEYDASNGCMVMTPIVGNDYCFVGGYERKNLCVKLGVADGKPTATKLWRNEKNLALSPVSVQPFQDGDVIYGYDDTGNMFAVELPSGKRLWQGTGPLGKVIQSGTAFIVKNGGHYFLFTETGDLVIADLNRDAYKEIDRTHLLEPTGLAFGRKVVWCMPAFADKKIFVRNDKEMICVDLAK